LDNPINAWVGGNLTDSTSARFSVTDSRFCFLVKFAELQTDSATSMIQELVDFRLATYEARQAADQPRSNVIQLGKRGRVELPFFPNLIACGHFRAGRADAERYVSLPATYGRLDPQKHFVAKASGNSMNGGTQPIRDGDDLLLELFTPTNLSSVAGDVTLIERQDSSGDYQYLLRVVMNAGQDRYVLRANNPDFEDIAAADEFRTLARLKRVVDPLDLQIGSNFLREAIPALFGETFNPGSWNGGHVVLNDKKIHVLFVTLNKQGKATEHRYHDYWVDERTFHWQSQNSTGPASKRGQEIINHERLGIRLHLFVRESKLLDGKGAPFVYFGKVRYHSHTGSNPMSVTLILQA
jgi:SOS-response transcriptional repressor LexA